MDSVHSPHFIIVSPVHIALFEVISGKNDDDDILDWLSRIIFRPTKILQILQIIPSLYR